MDVEPVEGVAVGAERLELNRLLAGMTDDVDLLRLIRAAAAAGSASLGGLWRQASFRWLWIADLVSKVGDATTVLVLPLIAIVGSSGGRSLVA